MLEDRSHDLVAVAHLGHHLEVGLEAEQRGQRAADQRLVVGEQQPDGHERTTEREAGGELAGDDRGAGVLGALAQPGEAGAVPVRRGDAGPSSRTSAWSA